MQGFGWAIAKQLAEAGAEISLGVWVSVCHEVWSMVDVLKQDGTFANWLAHHVLCPQVPALSIFEGSLRRGKFDANRKLANGGMLEFTNIYPMDAVYDTPEDVPEDVRLKFDINCLLLPPLHAIAD